MIMKTKINFTLIFLGLVFLFFSCSKEGVFYGSSVKYYESGTMQKGQLAKDTVIEGYPCESWVHFYPNGSLKQFTLAENFTVAGNNFSEKTTVFLTEEGSLLQVYLPHDQMIQGYQCTGGNMKSATGFYPSGKLRFFFPHQNTMVGEVLCSGGATMGIYLYESGDLQKAYAAEDMVVNGISYKKGDVIEL